MKKTSKNEEFFFCKNCDFECRWKSDWTRHLGTSKHKNQQISTGVNILSTEDNANDIIVIKHNCEYCSKAYKERSGLWRHQKKCIHKPINAFLQSDIINSSDLDYNKIDTSEVIMALLKDNKELKTMMAEQNNKIIELMSTKNNITNNITNNKTINQFNLNLFLNETCRDAMNINEFIENIEIQMKELEHVANNGYVAGITDIILTRLSQLDISKRPVHCTDLKRETIYVKDKDEWNRDTENNSKIKSMITKVANKNYRQIPKWRQLNPECQDPENDKYEFCINMMRNSLGELGDEQNRLDEKIIKNIAKVVVVEKN
jgi:hypothetical protein